MRLTQVAMGLSVAWLGVTGSNALAQNYPVKPIRIVTASPGSGSDGVARLIASGISGPLGQPVIVENRPSALTGDFAVKALPDGYTLLVEGNSFWLAPLIQKTPYDVLRDFSPVSIALLAPNVLVSHPSVPATTLADLVNLARAKPGQINYGSSGVGSSQQLAWELLNHMAKIKLTHVPYKGVVPALTAVIANEVQLVAATAALTVPHIKSGKIKAYAVTTPTPSPLLPGVAPVAAQGYPGYELVTRTALFACGKPPASIVKRLHQETIRVINSQETKDRFAVLGVEPVGNSPEEFAAIIKSDVVRFGKVIKDAGIKAD